MPFAVSAEAVCNLLDEFWGAREESCGADTDAGWAMDAALAPLLGGRREAARFSPAS